jgi:hypothetical protein
MLLHLVLLPFAPPIGERVTLVPETSASPT